MDCVVDHRAKLSKAGKKIFDEWLQACKDLNLSSEETTTTVSDKVTELLETHSLPPIRLIKFSDLKSLGKFPRCPENAKIAVELDKIDRNNSLLVFISHCWLRGYSGAEGWDGRPHPDNAAGEKYKLCVKGIQSLKNTFAPRMKDCYVWLDFGCINQDGNPAGELEQLDKIVQCCDCIFTPIVDHQYRQILKSSMNLFTDYRAKLWNVGPHAYLNRGWCRVEMLYAANIPVQENNAGPNGRVTVKRHTKFESGLAYHCSQNRRPHFLYGTQEYVAYNMPPLILPPLQHSYLADYNPMKGSLSVASDREHIEALMAELQPYLDANKVSVAYEGDVNESGLPHGRGTYRYTDGTVYEGEWKNGKREGQGLFRLVDGTLFQGEYKADKRNGYGVLRYADGDLFRGEFKNDLKNGRGTLMKMNGAIARGTFVNDDYPVSCECCTVCVGCFCCCGSCIWMRWVLPWYSGRKITPVMNVDS